MKFILKKKQLGENIKKIRDSKDLTQSYVSRCLGYKSPSSLSEIEAGKKGLDAEKIPLLSEILGVSINDIFFVHFIHITRIILNDY